MNWRQTQRGLHQSPANSQKQRTHARTHTWSQPAATALKLCLHGCTGNSLVSACVCAPRAVFPRQSKRSIPVYTDVSNPHIMKMAQFKEDSNRCRKRRKMQLRLTRGVGGGFFLHQTRRRILHGALKQQLSICPSRYSGFRDRDRHFPDSFLLFHKPPSPSFPTPTLHFPFSICSQAAHNPQFCSHLG